MLYDDKRWAPKADAFVVATLIGWLEAKPAGATYSYTTPTQCLLAEYFTAQGYRKVRILGDGFGHADGWSPLPSGWTEIAAGRPHTYGAALERARMMEGNGG